MSETKERVDDAKDRVRTETALRLRRYARRVKNKAIPHVEQAFKDNPDADPEVVAQEALAIAAQGLLPADERKRLPK
jgi:hypothetical protein